MSADGCHVYGCKRKTVPPFWFLCKSHWVMVGIEEKLAVRKAFPLGKKSLEWAKAAQSALASATKKEV